MSGAAGSSQWMYATGFDVDQSLRFNDDDSAYLSRTPTTAGNRKTFTFSAWVKAPQIVGYNGIFSGSNTGSIYSSIWFNAGTLVAFGYNAGTEYNLTTSSLYRDPSAWYHIVWSVDTTQATSSNRMKIYVNGEQVTAFNTETYPTLNLDLQVNNTISHLVGHSLGGVDYLDGYLGEVNFIDGTAKAPADFGETGDYGEWKPIAYSGTYGTNGFYLPFKQDYTVEGFSTTTYTGNGVSGHYIGGSGFQPDLTWIKQRSGGYSHVIANAISGSNKYLISEGTYAEDTDSTKFQTFATDGFNVGTHAGVNSSGQTYVAWNWDMGGSNASNTNGSITSTVRANPTYGQSIVSYTGNATDNQTIGHGLSSAPEMVIVKNRTTGGTVQTGWQIYHKDTGNNYYMQYTTAAKAAGAEAWNSTTPTSSLVHIGNSTHTNGSSQAYIAYCFHSVTGYSKFGKYTGNGNASGTSVTTGFEPAFVMVKGLSGDMTHKHWTIRDNTRSPNNDRTKGLHANKSEAEFDASNNAMAFSSTGFQLKGTDPGINENGIE